MPVRIRSVSSLGSLGLTLLALMVLATAHAPEPTATVPVPVLRQGDPPTTAPTPNALLVRIGLAALLLAGLAARLREGS
jgi:hypothetical protein